MTAIGPQGFPDFGRLDQQAATTLYRATAQAMAAPISVGTFYVGALQSIAVVANQAAAVSTGYVQLEFSDDMAATLINNFKNVYVDSNGTTYSVVPVMGNFVTVVFQASAFPANLTYSLLLQGLAWRGRGVDLLTPSRRLAVASSLVAGGGGTRTVQLPQCCEGKVTLCVQSDQAGHSTVIQQNQLGAGWLDAFNVDADSTHKVATGLGNLDAAPTQVVITNTNAAGANISAQLTYEP